MKVLAVNGSPRKEGNTHIMIMKVFEALEEEGIETELVQVGGKIIRGCLSCYKCIERKDRRCATGNDMFNDVFEKNACCRRHYPGLAHILCRHHP